MATRTSARGQRRRRLDWDEDEDEECDIETSGDRSSSPSGTTNHGAGKGWCYSDLDDLVGCRRRRATAGRCARTHTAMAWWPSTGKTATATARHDCECMEAVGEDESYLITRDSSPHQCGPDEGEGDDEDEYDDDLAPECGWGAIECLNDGTVMAVAGMQPRRGATVTCSTRRGAGAASGLATRTRIPGTTTKTTTATSTTRGACW